MVKANFVNKIGYGVIAGVVGSSITAILIFLASSIKLGADLIEFVSHQFLGTTAGNPNLVGYFIFQILGGAILGIIFAITIFLLMTRVGWERNLTRYLIVAIVLRVVFFLPGSSIISFAEDLVDVFIPFIIESIGFLILGVVYYYLEERFG
ncbi:MAG: hypothetical protein ACW99Q_27615 [Candidatus Kariarchaeaceae archaeon]